MKTFAMYRWALLVSLGISALLQTAGSVSAAPLTSALVRRPRARRVLEPAWWAAQQRAYPLSDVPLGAQQRAFRQMQRLQTQRGAAAAVASDRWVSIGPAPLMDITRQAMSGRVAALAVDPTDPAHWLLGAAQGGVWETRNAGTTWVPKTDDQVSLAFGAIAFAPSDPHIIYAGTGEANFRAVSYAGQGLLKSTDGGATWALLGETTFARTAFSDLAVDPHDPQAVVAATARGTAGRDAGWQVLPESIPAPPRGIFTSGDGGVTWSQRLNGEATDLEVNPTDFSQQYAGVGEIYGSALNGVYRSTDRGETWALIDGPWATTEGGIGRIEMALAPSNPNVLYVSIQDALDGVGPADGGLLGLFRTDNAWGPHPTWTRVATNAIDDGSGVHGYCGWDPLANTADDRCWYNHDVSVDPSNPDVLYGGGNGLWRFDGSTWTEIAKVALITRRSIHTDQHSLVWAGNRLIVGNDGGVWSTTTAGETWINHNATLAITQFYKGALHPTNPSFALGGNQDNGFVKWTGTDTWGFVYVADGMETAVASSRPDTHWALASQFLTIVRTTDGAAVPILIPPADAGIDKTGAPFIARMEKCPANDDVFIAGTDNLWRSSDFFSAESPSWSANGPEMGNCVIGSTTAGCITAIAFAAADNTCNTYAFGTGDGRLRLTTDSGLTWGDLDAGNAVPDRFVTDLAFAPADSNTLYVTLSGFDEGTPGQPGHVFKTTAALGASPHWVNASPPVDLPQDSVAVDPVDANLVYVGADLGVWKSADGATNWAHLGPDTGIPNVAVFDLEIQPSTRRVFAFTHGRGAFVQACRGVADCDDGNASNGAETCDVVTGRCVSGAAVATVTPTPSAPPTSSSTATALATSTATVTPSRPSPTATLAPTSTATVVPTRAATSTTGPTRTATPAASATMTAGGTASESEDGCAIAMPARGGGRHASAAIVIAGGLFLWMRRRS